MIHRCNSTKIFGKTFHKNMSASDLQQSWQSIPEELKSKNKDIETLISKAVMVENMAKGFVTTYQGLKMALKVQEEAVMSAAASTASNPTYDIAKAAAEQAFSKITDLANQAKEASFSLYNTIETRMKEIGGCNETNEVEQQKQDVL